MSNLRRGFKTWCENAARSFRRDLGLANISPLDPRALGKHLEIEIWAPEKIPGLKPDVVKHLTVTDASSWDAVTIQWGGRTLIILNSTPPLGRQNNSLAHELSHIILRHEPTHMFHTADGQMVVNEYNVTHEEEADCLASTLLVPRDALLHAIREGMTEPKLATHFGVSPQLLRMRRNTTGVNRQLSYAARR